MLEIHNLHVSVDSKPVLNGVSLTIKPGEVHALMGPNGSGKSTLSNVILGHPKYEVTQGDIKLNGKSILKLAPHDRALAGLFLAFQSPREVTGITLEEFLLAAYRAKQKHLHPDKPPVLVFRFKKMLLELMAKLHMDEKFANRYLNHGFSGGEKKKCEVLQMAVLEPNMAILDETDSGLDVDALKSVCDGIKSVRKNATHPMGILVVTHFTRILKYLKPDFVHVMKGGILIKSGGANFAHELEKNGYENI
jgi:Fe-S cluster assembly ATP-binding protein